MNDLFTIPPRSSFSGPFQLAWDSTSLTALKICPRYYYYNIVLGLVPRAESIHLRFGIELHQAKEHYDRARAEGRDHDTAVIDVVGSALDRTWNYELSRPNFLGDEYKNRFTLIRTIVWYFDEYKNDPLVTLRLAEGRPAVELSFAFDTQYVARSADRPYTLCGHIDRVAEFQGSSYVCDVKTTKHTISSQFFAQFSPHNQFTLYTLASYIAFALPVRGVIVDAAQVAVTFSRFERQIVSRQRSQLDEWYDELEMWLRSAERYAATARWPMNESSCDRYGGCPYRKVCSHAHGAREPWLRADYTKRIWDPLNVRGDI